MGGPALLSKSGPGAASVPARWARLRPGRVAAVVVAVSVVAAACSSAPPTGSVGTTLPAVNGTVKLDAVLSPAPLSYGSPSHASKGHKLVAVVLTVHNPGSGSAKFGSLYSSSRLIDSKQLTHVGVSTKRYHVAECNRYPMFGTVPADKSVTGCDIFQISTGLLPVKLKIGGKLKAEWDISYKSIVVGREPILPKGFGKSATKKIPKKIPKKFPTTTTTTPITIAAGGSPTTGGKGSGSGSGSPKTQHNRTFHLPTITRVSPNSSPPGQSVTIYGHRLLGVESVTFGGVRGTVTLDKKHLVVVTVPPTGRSGEIAVTTPLGTARSPKSFEVQ